MTIDAASLAVIGAVIGIVAAVGPVMFFIGRLVQLPKTVARIHKRISDIESNHYDLVQQLVYKRLVEPPALKRAVTGTVSVVDEYGHPLLEKDNTE